MEQIQVVNNNGLYDCNINITTKEWIELLRDSDVTQPNTWKALLGFYNSPNHTANCKELDNNNSNAYKNPISAFGKRVQDKLDRFQILKTDGKSKGDYFAISMIGYDKKNAFLWTVRPELVEAIRDILKIHEKLIPEAIKQYKQKLKNDPVYWDGKPENKSKFGEKYKWEAIAHFQNNWKIDAPNFYEMFEKSTSETRNLLEVRSNRYNWHPRGMCLIFAKYEPVQTREMFRCLFDEDIDLKYRIHFFRQKAKELRKEIELQHKDDEPNVLFGDFQNTNAVSTYLWLNNPKKYYKFAPEIYCTIRERLCLYQYCINKRDGTVNAMLEGFAMYDYLREKLLKDEELVNMINSRVEKLHLEKDFEDDFRTATIDFGYFVSEYFQSKLQLTQEIKNMSNKNPYQDIVDLIKFKKNVILQGAPGTGKTYSTAAIALGILGVKDVDFNDHPAVMKRYDELRNKERIFFTTFHQSMDYEDFVEGVKPELTDNGISYEIKKGIFRLICESANSLFSEKRSNEIDFTQTRIFKMSLGKKDYDDAEIFGYCKENNVVALGWGGEEDFSDCHVTKDFQKKDKTWGAKALEIFKCWMQVGDIVLISDGNSAVKAIAKIVGNYEFHNDAPIAMCQFRKVEWLYIGDSIPISKLYDRQLSQQSIYGFYNSNRKGTSEFNGSIKTDMINDIITAKVNTEKPQPHVLIIDEINRGNVSKIFGELVTLLEADKRSDGDHPITVTLPYSKKDFRVPSNVYIIGTMNTTDRSTGTIDYAVRRRFAFVTLPAKRDVIQLEIAQKLFDNIQDFIKKNHSPDMDMDDLMVGHSYFMAEKDDGLKLKIKYEVIPLLKEYCNDGLLTCNQEYLNNHIKAWEKLEIYNKEKSNTTNDSATATQDSEIE